MSRKGTRRRTGVRRGSTLVATFVFFTACGDPPSTVGFRSGDAVLDGVGMDMEEPSDVDAATAADVDVDVDAADATADTDAAPDAAAADAADAAAAPDAAPDAADTADVPEADMSPEDSVEACTAPCENGGSCTGGVCECLSGWGGATCTEFVCAGDCERFGRCIGPNQCRCDPGWYGVSCTVEGQRQLPIGAVSGAVGSPESEIGRVPSRERRRQVDVTRPFLIHDTEMTRAEWGDLASLQLEGQRLLPEGMAGDGEELPVTNMTWWSAVAAANALSERDGLTPCYDVTLEELLECTSGGVQIRSSTEMWQAVFSGRMECRPELPSAFKDRDGAPGDMLDCEGWRLPTEVEWELAARTVGQNGMMLGSAMYDTMGRASDVRVEPVGACDASSLGLLLDGIAWWCGNSTGAPGAVRAKAPTSSGLYEMLGNVAEWVWDGFDSEAPAGSDVRTDAPAVSCFNGALNELTCRVRRGGAYSDSTDNGLVPWRFAFRAPAGAARRSPGIGVRWVRTGTP